MQCPKCQKENEEDALFCGECGAKLTRSCPSCGRELKPQDKFCTKCGQPLASGAAQVARPSPDAYTPKHLADKILNARDSLEGERKTITALFADIKGSMELIEELDPEDARRIIDPALRRMMDSVHRYGGYVAQSTGDGIFALFGAPIAHEDHAQRALYAALLMQNEIAKYEDELRLEIGVPIHIRVGINTGEVVVRSIRTDDLHTDYVPVGHSTSLAARMESVARPGSIVVTGHTHKLAQGYFCFKNLGPTKVKGASEPVDIFEVTGIGPLRTRLQVAAQRGLVRFVGRVRELEQIREALEMAEQGHGQILAVMGEAGVGKSRLFYEFKAPLGSRDAVLEAFSVSHGKAYAYLPLIDLLKGYFQIATQDDERTRREKITGKVLTLDRSLEDTLPYLFALIGLSESSSFLGEMDPQIRRKRTMEAVKRLLVRESLNQPMVLIFEDLHWIDAETQAFLDMLADESVATARLLLLVNYRPEYRHAWASKTYYSRVRLDPLGEDEAQELLTALLGENAELRSLEELILEKTEGNPFFMEEVVQTLAEEHALAGQRGRYRLEKAPSALHIPETVQGVLASRIDRLGAKEKELLQTMAVIGKEFPFGLLRRVAGQAEEQLYGLISHLQNAEFIYEQPALPEPEYTFKHGLTQEVAYNSLLIDRRKELHESAAQAVEELYRDSLDEHYGELARHYSRTDNAMKAVEYLRLAGQQALERSAFGEALTQLSEGINLTKGLAESGQRMRQELLLQMSLASASVAVKGFAAAESKDAYLRASELCNEVGDPSQVVQVLWGLCAIHIAKPELDSAQKIAEQLLNFAESTGEPVYRAMAHALCGTTAYWLGQFTYARTHLEQGISLYDPQRAEAVSLPTSAAQPDVDCRCYLSLALWALGYPDQAMARATESLTLAQQSSRPFTVGWSLLWVGANHLVRGELQAAMEDLEAMIALAEEHGFPNWLVVGRVLLGEVLILGGHEEEGMPLVQQGLDASRLEELECGKSVYLARLALGYKGLEQYDQGLEAVSEAIEFMDWTGERVAEPMLHQTRGELLLGRSDAGEEEAERWFHQAIETARRAHTKSHELRATMCLARLWQQQGKKAQARTMLSEIYDWFTEGFDTADLKDAKALLEELS